MLTDITADLTPSNDSVFTPENEARSIERMIIETVEADIIMHSSLKAALDTIDAVHALNKSGLERKHVAIVGESGCGKTTLRRVLAKRHGVTINKNQFLQLRTQTLVMASVPSPVTPRAMAAEYMKGLDAKVSKRSTTQELTEQLPLQFKYAGTEIALADEYQHLLAASGLARRQQSIDWTKTFMDRCDITFVMLGMPALMDILVSDAQLFRRILKICHLKPFSAPESGKNEMGCFVEELLYNLVTTVRCFDDFEPFADHVDSSLRIHAATSGNPAHIKRHVCEAALSAFRRGSTRIDMQDFIAACNAITIPLQKARQSIQKSRQKSAVASPLMIDGQILNPFEADIATVAAYCHREAA